jgi:hypothetical protein
MLSIRMIIFAGIGGICLWGLFSLLDNLKEPALLRTTKGVAVKGCGDLEAHEDAPKLCPAYLCQKALFDRKLAAADNKAEITNDIADGNDRVIQGRLQNTNETFECVVNGVTVRTAELTTAGQLDVIRRN